MVIFKIKFYDTIVGQYYGLTIEPSISNPFALRKCLGLIWCGTWNMKWNMLCGVWNEIWYMEW